MMNQAKVQSASAWPRRPHTPLEATIRELGDRLVQAQRSIRILHGVQWDDGIEQAFFARQARELPTVTADYYHAHPLPFQPYLKQAELWQIERDTLARLGRDHPAGQIILRMCSEFQTAVAMLKQRGTPAFAALSAKLFGRAADVIEPGGPTIADHGRTLAQPPCSHSENASQSSPEPNLDSQQAVLVLSERLKDYFQETGPIRVCLSDGIAADAAAGCDYLKLRRHARFSPRDLRLLEVHEGWVHLGTTLNGQRQPVCSFLSRGTPSSTLTQEGLAVLTEMASKASHPGRMKRLSLRVAGVAMAEGGANFLEVYRWFLDEGVESTESYHLAARVFRGSLPEGCGPFTKDLCYSRGFVLVGQHLQHCLVSGQSQQVPLLFSGKTALVDLPALTQLAEDGLIEAPRYLPPPFANAQAIASWLGAILPSR